MTCGSLLAALTCVDAQCRLPDGSFWPEVQEGMHQVDHGVVICKLCQRHHKANNFAGEGYRWACP